MMKRTVKASDFESVESNVLKTIVPAEPILPRVNKFIKSLEATAKKLKLDCRIVIGGSVAKDTHLAGDFDCDVFVRFSPKKYADDEIASQLKKIVESHNAPKLDAQLLHGSRDYYKMVVDAVTYELVPTLDVAQAKDAPNITDMSLFHVDWTVSQCKKHKAKKDADKLNNQIRLAKAFCKGQNVYGAESYIGGFSGHVLDILVVACGDFRELLEQSQKWKDKEVVDVEEHYKTSALATLSLNEAKLTSPIIVIDPIVAERNAASALTKKCFEMFRKSAAQYLTKPSVDYFAKSTFDPVLLNSVAGITYSVSVVPLSDKKDIAGAQHVKVLEYVIEQAKLHEFNVVGNGWSWDENQNGTLFVRVEKDELSATTLVRGPPLRIPEAVKTFKSIHKKVVEKDSVLWATVQRKFSHFGSLLDAVAKHDLVTIRAKSFSWKKLK